jgi:hypothetical protein
MPFIIHTVQSGSITILRADDIFAAFDPKQDFLFWPYLEHADERVRLTAALPLGRHDSTDERVTNALKAAIANLDGELKNRAVSALKKP